MFSCRMLLCALALTLLAVTVQSWSDGNLSGAELTELYNSPVHEAERMRRPLRRWPFMVGDLSHSGVRVTLDDGSQWLIHKGDNFGRSSQTVVTPAHDMSSKWKADPHSRDFQGERTVADFVEAGGSNYNLRKDNCHHAADRMMNQ